MAPKQFACCYFPADCGAVVLEKKKLALRSDFKPLGEIDVKFTIENEKGEKETVIYFGQILKILTDKNKLDVFRNYVEEKLKERKGQGTIDKDYLHALTILDDSEWNTQEGEQSEIIGKRKRKMTAVMEASKSQELEYENLSKKKKTEEPTLSSQNKSNQKQSKSIPKQNDKSDFNKENIKKLQTSVARSKASVKTAQKKVEVLASIELEGAINNVPFGFMKQFNQQMNVNTLSSSSKDNRSVIDTSQEKTKQTEVAKPKSPNAHVNIKEAEAASNMSVQPKIVHKESDPHATPSKYSTVSNTKSRKYSPEEQPTSSSPNSNTTLINNLPESFVDDSHESHFVDCFLPKEDSQQEGSSGYWRNLLDTPEITPSEANSFTILQKFNLSEENIKLQRELESVKWQVENLTRENEELKAKLQNWNDESQVENLRKENEELKEKLQSENDSMHVPAEVLSWMENVVASARSGNLSGTELQRYVVRANLNPSKNGPPQTRLLEDHNILVNREELFKATNAAVKHRNPKQLLGNIIRLVFGEEELSNSRGQGIRHDKVENQKPALDTDKCRICKDFIRSWCMKQEPPVEWQEEKLNEVFTNQVAYARKRLNLVSIQKKTKC